MSDLVHDILTESYKSLLSGECKTLVDAIDKACGKVEARAVCKTPSCERLAFDQRQALINTLCVLQAGHADTVDDAIALEMTHIPYGYCCHMCQQGQM